MFGQTNNNKYETVSLISYASKPFGDVQKAIEFRGGNFFLGDYENGVSKATALIPYGMRGEIEGICRKEDVKLY